METSPKVFISYSHGDKNSQDWVEKLSTDLRQHLGVDVIFDKWDLRIGNNLALFMEQGLSDSALVLCICSDEYVRKADEGVGGVSYERMIITQELMANVNSEYVIPVIRENKGHKLPLFLSARCYIDFSDDNLYLEKLSQLTARIYNEDLKQKPPIGENPYSTKVVNEVTVRTSIEQSKYHNPKMTGSASFNFLNNSGKYIIGTGEYEFITSWSECGSQSVYAYRDFVQLIGCSSQTKEIPTEKNFDIFDFTSRARVGKSETLLFG